MSLRFVLIVASFSIGLAVAPRAQVEVRVSSASVDLDGWKAAGRILEVRGDIPLAVLDHGPARGIQIQAFGGISGLRIRAHSGLDVIESRTIGTAEVGLALRAGWIELAIGPSLRYRSGYSFHLPEFGGSVTEVEVKRADVGGVIEGGFRVPLTKTFRVGAHVSLRQYNQGAQMAGLGLSASLGF